jgi:nucleotide-binding universal stress UspA family protein
VSRIKPTAAPGGTLGLQADPADHEGDTMKILAAVDGSSYTKRMLAYLTAHDEWLGSHHSYTLVHAVTPLPQRAAAAIDKTTLQAWHDETAQKVFKPIRSFFEKQGIQATYVAKAGAPADVIAGLAKKGDFDLLILGSHGHGALTNLVTGSVATKVLAQCSTPALLIR